MANELLISYPTGATLYVLLFDAIGQIWNVGAGGVFDVPTSVSWREYDIPMTEVEVATGLYRASMPAVTAGMYGWMVRKQTGSWPVGDDVTVGTGEIRWTGTAEETVPAAVNVTTLADGALIAIADAILTRDFSAVTGAASRSLLNAVRFLRNRWFVSGPTLTVTEEDDTTAAWTALLTTDETANPITGSDPG